MSSYAGGCHCGAIRFRVSGVIDELGECNCSICAKTAYLHWEVITVVHGTSSAARCSRLVFTPSLVVATRSAPW